MKDHIVQFYRDDAFLAERVAAWLDSGLERGAACIVVATSAHRDLLRKRLRASRPGFDAAIQSGQYVEIEAAELLSKIMVGDAPDARRFRESVGRLVADARSRRLEIRVYGEMVSLLCEQGDRTAAIRLEVLWNELMREESLSLLCSYSMRAFHEQGHCDAILQICAQHAQLVPPESRDESADPSQRIRTTVSLQPRS